MSSDVQIGERRMSYTMQPLAANGHAFNGGNDYANADTIEAARDYASRVLASDTVHGVDITGELMEFRAAWRPVTGPDARWEHEVIARPQPAPLTAADSRKSCYPTTIRDFLETVHERRSDGSCRCGHYAPQSLTGRLTP